MDNELLRIMRARHSVRQYLDKPVPADIREKLDAYAAELNRRGGLHMQIIYDEPSCFNSFMAHYGKFTGCADYIVLAGRKAPDLDERCGFYGELLVLKAQELGLNTCWAAMTHGKSKAVLEAGEKEVIVISLGYGKTPGNPRKSKTAAEVSDLTGGAPEWYRNGVEAALLAPTAMNQQKFFFTREGNAVTARADRFGSCLKIDLGIVKCHFELGAGTENFEWRQET